MKIHLDIEGQQAQTYTIGRIARHTWHENPDDSDDMILVYEVEVGKKKEIIEAVTQDFSYSFSSMHFL